MAQSSGRAPARKATAKRTPDPAHAAQVMSDPLVDQFATFVLGAVLAFLAFTSVIVHEGLVGAAGFGLGVMRVVFAGMVAGLTARSGHASWLPTAAGTTGAMIAAITLQAVYPHLSVEAVLLQAIAVAPLAFAVSFAVRRGLATAVSAVTLVFVCAAFLWQVGVMPGVPRDLTASMRQQMAADPMPEQYGFDGEIYARTVTLVKADTPYYRAFAQAFDEDSRLSGEPPGVLNFRQRWLTEVWALVPGSGRSAPWRALVVFAIATMLAAYGLARRYAGPSAALLGPMWLATYFTAALLSQWYPFAELYGGGLAVIMLWLVSRQRWFAAAVALTLAVAARELMLVLVVVYVVAWALNPRRRDELAALAVALVAPAATIAYHLTTAPGGAATGGSLQTWLGDAGLPRVQEALLFLTEFIPFAPTLVFVWVVAALAGGLTVPVWWRKAALTGAALAPLILLFLFSASEWDYYWGSIATPLMLALAPVVATVLAPSRAAISDRCTARATATPAKVRVVLPAYNEAASIVDLLARIDEVMREHAQPYAVLVVDDGSADETARLAEECAPRVPVTVVRNRENLGLGGAILRGLKAASRASKPGDVIVTLDADLTQDPGYIPDLIARWAAGADIVIASRYRPGSRVVGLSAFRRFMTLGARAGMSVAMYVEGARDYSCGFRLYDAGALAEAFDRYGDGLVTERGFACMVEILGRMRSIARVEEVPFVLHYEAKRSASTMRVGATVRAYFRVVIRVTAEELRGQGRVTA